jgi:hypothetical protein
MRIHSHTQINTTIHLNSNVNYKFGGISLLSKIQNLQSSHISSRVIKKIFDAMNRTISKL